jgi:hypothetical protein
LPPTRATWTYQELRGYQPLLGIITEPGCMVAGEFRQGSHSPQEGLDRFVKQCMDQNSRGAGFQACAAQDQSPYPICTFVAQARTHNIKWHPLAQKKV